MSAPYNPFDRPANAAAAETTGAAVASRLEVKLVDAEDINDIDRKTESSPALSSNPAPADGSQTHSEQASVTGCGGSGLRLGARSRRWQRRCNQLVRVDRLTRQALQLGERLVGCVLAGFARRIDDAIKPAVAEQHQAILAGRVAGRIAQADRIKLRASSVRKAGSDMNSIAHAVGSFR